MWWVSLAIAQGPVDPHADVRTAASELAEDEEYRAARALLKWVLAQDDLSAALRAEVEADLAALPADASTWAPRVKLAALQAGLGAAAGPLLVEIRNPYTPPGVVFATSLLGGLAGGGSAFVYRRQGGVTGGQSTAILLGEHLGLAHGLVIGASVDQGNFNPGRPREKGTPIGALVGTVAGIGLGYGVAELDPDVDDMTGAYSGAMWGAGLTLAALGVTYQYGKAETPAGIELPVVIGADVGAAGGYLLARGLHLNRASIWAANLGGAAGVGLATGFMAATQEAVPYAPHTVAWGIGGAAVAGGAAGILLTRGARASAPLDEVVFAPSFDPRAPGVVLAFPL